MGLFFVTCAKKNAVSCFFQKEARDGTLKNRKAYLIKANLLGNPLLGHPLHGGHPKNARLLERADSRFITR